MDMKKYILYLAAIFLFTSCEDWLDVKPKSEIEGSELFSTEQGFKDALTGIYTAMSAESLYGCEMTYGLVDVIGDAYYSGAIYSGTAYAYARNHQYDQTNVETLINSIWQGCYNAIATINNTLENLEQADSTMFGVDNYNVIKGELLGLRAFLHFDLLRLFAPSYAVGATENAIPYVTTYGYEITPQSTVSEVIDYILADLEEAADCLETSDPILTGREITAADDNGYLLNRQYHFNYYAVIATMANVYLYKGDHANARKYALEVIDSGKFPWTSVDDIATSSVADRDRTFTSEQIFALQITDLNDYVLGKVYGTIQYRVQLAIYTYWIDYAIWPAETHATDWRKVYFVTNDGTQSTSYYTSSKLWQEDMNENYVQRMPLIRLPEMYLILAEADVANGAEYLNVIREHRGVTAQVTATGDALLDEIGLETYREFINEGKLFYWYKRLNRTTHWGGYYFENTVQFNPDLYVLPMPEEEIEFGNRN